MEKIFHTTINAYPDSKTALRFVLREFLGIENAEISKNENSKPFLIRTPYPLHFSISHTNNKLFIAFCDENVGLDVESLDRDVLCAPIIKKFHITEREEITSAELFLRHWTAKEATVKWLGGTLAKDLYKLDFIDGQMRYGEILLPLHFAFFTIENYLLCICAERLEDAPLDIEKIVL
jgi:phosphopantetheinyl transferase